jgi:hypothetical protein
MNLRLIVVTPLIFVAGCTFVRGKGSSFQPHAGTPENAFQEHYYNIREEAPGVNTCTAKPPLQNLLEEPYRCSLELTSCKAGIETVAGRLDASYETLFADTLSRTGGQFDYVCKGGSNPADLHLLGLNGLAYAGNSAHLDRMLAVDDPAQRDADWHVAMRPALAFALFQAGDRERALPKIVELAQLSGGDDAARARSVLYVGRWESDGLIDTCTKALSEPASEPMAQACAWYLGRRKVGEALPLLGNNDPRLGLAGIRALGLTGDARATEMVTRAMNPATATDEQRIVARVALLNLGKKDALRDYLGMLSGSIGARRAANTTPRLSPEEVAREAALEVLALTNRGFDKEITKALRRTTTAIKNEQTAAAAWIALAYLGDDQAFDILAQLIGGDNADFNNAMLVFTDGEQNNAKFVVDNGTKLLLNTTNSPIGGSEVVPAGKQLMLCPFKLRTSNAADAANQLLQTMADRSGCGPLNLPLTLDDPPLDAIQYFVQVLNGTLIGDKLELLHVSHGMQPATPGTVPPPLAMSFKTSKQDLAFTALLGWNFGFQVEGQPAIKLSKDGVDFLVGQDPNVRLDTGSRHVAITLRKPFCNVARQCVQAQGSWTLTVGRTMARGDGRWSLLVVGDNATLASQFSAVQARPGVGNPMRLQARLTEGGQPLAGLAADSVRAFVSAPGQGLGNVISASATKPGDPNPTDPGIAANAKVRAMLANPAERAAILAALQFGAEQGIPLAETSPGVYAADFPATTAEGVYRVTFRVGATSAGNGAFERVFSTDRYVPVQPDDAATAATMTIAAATSCADRFVGGCKQVTFRPVDQAGNLVGPGKASSIFFGGAGSEVVGEVQDTLDGRYTLVVGHLQKDAGQVPPLVVNGVALNLPPAAGPGGAGGVVDILLELLLGWWWLLLLLLIALVIWLLKR